MTPLTKDLIWIALGFIELSVGFAIIAVAVEAVLS